MACGGCGGARAQAWQGIKRGNIYQVAQAARTAYQINVDKIRGTYDDSRYTRQQPTQHPVNKATPYRRPPDRTT